MRLHGFRAFLISLVLASLVSGAMALADHTPRSEPPYLVTPMRKVPSAFQGLPLSDRELARARIHIVDGRLIDGDGKPFDTAARGGQTIFVMGQDGMLYAAGSKLGVVHHNGFLRDGPVAAAGELVAREGLLLELNDQSGHYLPKPFMLEQLLSELTRQGADLSQAELVKIKSEPSFPRASVQLIQGRILRLLKEPAEMRSVIDQQIARLPQLKSARRLSYLVQLIAWGDERESIIQSVLHFSGLTRGEFGILSTMHGNRMMQNDRFMKLAAAQLSSLPQAHQEIVIELLERAGPQAVEALAAGLEVEMLRLLPQGDGSSARDLARILARYGHRTEAVVNTLQKAAERRTYGPVRRIFLRAEMELKLWGYQCSEALNNPDF